MYALVGNLRAKESFKLQNNSYEFTLISVDCFSNVWHSSTFARLHIKLKITTGGEYADRKQGIKANGPTDIITLVQLMVINSCAKLIAHLIEMPHQYILIRNY